MDQAKNSKNDQNMQYVMRFDQEFWKENSFRLAIAIERNKPILKSKGGRFDEDDLDLYLGLFDELDQAYQMGLITKDLVYDNYSDDLIKAFNNPEIKNYLQKIRKEDSAYFINAEDLEKMCLDYKNQK